MEATRFILSLSNIQTHTEPGFLVRINGGRGVIIAMDCVGYGVYSFWVAFVGANAGSWQRKTGWMIFGLLLLWLINVIRITLFLLAINKGWPMPLGIDHHTWFTIVAYGMIFLLIWQYDKKTGDKILQKERKSSNLDAN